MAKKKAILYINLVLLCLEVLGGTQTLKRCTHGKVFLRKHVEVPACYNKVDLHQKCLDKRQCIDRMAYCGFEYQTNLTELRVCVCNDYAKEVNGKCVVRHYCSLPGLNPDYLQADCPEKTFCEQYHCLCLPVYTYNPLVDECVPRYRGNGEEEKEKEEGKVYTGTHGPMWKQFDNINSTNSSDSNNPFDLVAYAPTIILSLFIGTFALFWLVVGLLRAFKYCRSKQYTNVPQKEEIALSVLSHQA